MYVDEAGSGSQWINLDDLTAGNKGYGTLNVEAGGEVSNTVGYSGRYPGAMGTAKVTGAGS